MWGFEAVVWAVCLACVQPSVFAGVLTFRPSEDRPRPAPDDSADKVECFSDYMALKIPRSHVEGLRQWLSRGLHLPGHLDPILAQCGYSLHPAPDGDFIFRALYSACSVRKEVSRPLPLRKDSGQTPWLLSLRGELVASLEDASLMGLYVDVNATTVTVQSPRRDPLQTQEVLHTSVELLPLWLVSGHYAYSLEATCPAVSSQPGLEVLVHIPRQRRGLVKRGSRVQEALNLKSLYVYQSDTFNVTENRDFVVVSIPAAVLLQVQPCQEAQGGPGTQAFYRVDLRLDFTQSAVPGLWTVENYFQCTEGSGPELPVSIATLKTTSSLLPPGPESPPSGTPPAASQLFQNTASGARGIAHWPSHKLAEPEPGTATPGEGSWLSSVPLFSGVSQDQLGSQAPPQESGLHRPPSTLATQSAEPPGAAQAASRPSHPVRPAPTVSATRWSSEAPSPWRANRSKVLLGSGLSVAVTQGSETTSSQPDPAHSPGAAAAATEALWGESDQAEERFWPRGRTSMSNLAGDELDPQHSHRIPQETSSIMGTQESPLSDQGHPREGARGRPDGSSPEPSQRMERMRPVILLGTGTAVTTSGEGQPDTSIPPGTSEPATPEWPPVGSGAPDSSSHEPCCSTSQRPPTLSMGDLDRAPDLGSTPEGPVGQHGVRGAHTASPSPLPALSFQTPPAGALVPSLDEPGNSFPGDHKASLQQDPTQRAFWEALHQASGEGPGVQPGGTSGRAREWGTVPGMPS